MLLGDRRRSILSRGVWSRQQPAAGRMSSWTRHRCKTKWRKTKNVSSARHSAESYSYPRKSEYRILPRMSRKSVFKDRQKSPSYVGMYFYCILEHVCHTHIILKKAKIMTWSRDMCSVEYESLQPAFCTQVFCTKCILDTYCTCRLSFYCMWVTALWQSPVTALLTLLHAALPYRVSLLW